MHKVLACTCALVLAGAAWADDEAKVTPGTYGLYADGTWDCSDSGGTYLGAVVIADLSYAFIYPDRTVGAYGKLNKDDWLDKPGFFILSGELKDKFGAVGMALRGPGENFEDLSDWSKNILQVVSTPESVFNCVQRRGPAS
jgi:hypothetical protein